MQLKEGSRGFSFMQEGPLDMRMDPNSKLTADEIVNSWNEEKLGALLRDFGEEPRWRKAAKAIIEERRKKMIKTTKHLAETIARAFGGMKRAFHPATLIFQALRICVNRELESVQEALPKAIRLLKSGGRIGILSFHSLEDRIVKTIFKEAARAPKKREKKDFSPTLKLLTKKPARPTSDEVRENPSARSARLRFAEKL
ncbi:MAG: 16S rRNA (cytosine(1402)-N(4))-methyltransferase RsmH [Chlamydiae bacterium]|nr:16S rRNA (cytosine(1402)-N(4))-methyltransferase RsmH [Chlamydiota bacterium]